MEEDTESPEFNCDEIVSTWLENYNAGVLRAEDFRNVWQDTVPYFYSPSMDDTCLTWGFNEELAQSVLFSTLERFICGDASVEILTSINEAEKPSSVCGHVFKMGEPTYSCRECGVDNTCVLCVTCFKQSDHKSHKYKMGNSGGGGCCDCGDVEAWKQSPWCAAHAERRSNDTTNLPNDICERSRIVIDAILWYVYHQLNNAQLGGISDRSFSTDLYCTILYNDEVHTFDQVIATLTRVKLCAQRTAIEFVTNIDREGRAVVKCSTFNKCNELKQEIEKHTSRHGSKPLNVVVCHSHIIAYQIYAIKLLEWLQNILNNSKSLRAIFADLALESHLSDPCIIKGVLLGDSRLWKNARTQWQRLLISGMLFEYENKKALAVHFTKNYGAIMKDFIKDDHDHSYSISSLSVQLFTVPTLAHYLIANNDVLYILLNTFLSECTTKCNKSGRLEFERSPSSHSFKRAQYVLYDLRYILSSIPQQWTDDLRRNFLHSLHILLELLVKMQSMDPFTRQTGQHMEYEPEWESAFNLHIKLAYCISLVLKWCSTDKVVLVKAYRAVLNLLEKTPILVQEPDEVWEMRELVDHSATCLVYDVSTRPVSIHLALSRFFAGLHLHLEQYGLHFDSIEFQQQTSKPTPVQIMEPVLRCQVMIAQVHAGMWRRNGYALINQLYYYHNVKCRTEMLDRDIVLLQICASLVESNEFLIHMLYKFNLLHWATSTYEADTLKTPEEDSMKQIISLVEEFLQLIIIIVSERYIPGISSVTVEDRIKKEIIQYLAIKPLPHSELNRIIPDDLSHEMAVDDVIGDLAIFNKPKQLSGKGVYELKTQFLKDFNVFFYHYTREELSKSEESQRKRRKAAGELECSPPSSLIKLNESFTPLVNILQCDVSLHIMDIILDRFNNLRARSTSELQLHKVLHLIGLALLEEESGNYPFFKFVQNSTKFKLLERLTALLTSPRVDAQKGLLKWTIRKFNEMANNQNDTTTTINPLLTSDNDTAFIDSDKERRAKLAAERRLKLMSQMVTMQKNFMKENAALFESDNSPDTSSGSGRPTSESLMEICDDGTQPIALGPRQSLRSYSEKSFTCILCQEVVIFSNEHESVLVLAAFIQQATVLCPPKRDEENYRIFYTAKHENLLYNKLGPAPYTSTCGHVMHYDCWRKYFDNVMSREQRRPYRLRHPSSFDVDKQEFLCPLCECLSNAVLPLIPPLIMKADNVEVENVISYDDWLQNMFAILQRKVKTCHGVFRCNAVNCSNEHCVACMNSAYGTTNTENAPPNDAACKVNYTLQPYQVFQSCQLDHLPNDTTPTFDTFKTLFCAPYFELTSNLQDCIKNFTQITFSRDWLHPTYNAKDKHYITLLWKSLAYTIHSIEVLLQDSHKPLLGNLSSRQRDCLEYLTRIVATANNCGLVKTDINNFATQLLTFLFEDYNKHPDDNVPSIIEWDSVGLLVSITFSVRSLICNESAPIPAPDGGTLDLYILRTVFIAHIVKILLLTNASEFVGESSECVGVDESDRLKWIIGLIKGTSKWQYNGEIIWTCVQQACRPFLRCCCLFYHYLTDVPAPAILCETDGDTYSNMCLYLDLPQHPSELFASDLVCSQVEKWSCHWLLQFRNAIDASLLKTTAMGVDHRLIELPNDYSELINAVSTFTCPNNEEVSRNPTMCLVCGEILCSQTYCCQTEINKTNVGACNFHAFKCGAGAGIFLRVKECEVLLLAPPHRGCYVTAPYVDDYGETDQGLRRGNPLKLCAERYKKLQILWLSHGIHEEIARSMDTNSHVITTQWNHL